MRRKERFTLFSHLMDDDGAMDDGLSASSEHYIAEKKRIDELQAYERDALGRGYVLVAGLDEAGRGPLAGPVVAAAAVFSTLPFIPLVNDSKRLVEMEREGLLSWIERKTHCCAAGMATAEEIDRLNIHRASLLAMHRAVSSLPAAPDFILVDGKFSIPEVNARQVAVVRGDSRCFSIACASIMAKVLRDRMMDDYDREYPQYGFSRHKGYPTPEHVRALAHHGPCPIHRRSYGPVRDCLESRKMSGSE